MLNKLLSFIRQNGLIAAGDRVICAVSGGADSVAMLFALYLLKEKLGIQLEAAHFNHHLRGDESDADEAFVRSFCEQFDIPLYVGAGRIKAGKKGLEAAARDARYAFFETLDGKVATAHTADDNAETVLMHLVRGTGLKGLGGIAPVRGKVIRPMLSITRDQVLSFVEEYHLRYVDDSSNATDQFLRNRLRHHVVPLLREENPCLAENLSAMALRLREDEKVLSDLAEGVSDVSALRDMRPAVRSRALANFLQRNGVKEPEAVHISLVERLVFSEKPSASADLPGGITVCREYNSLTVRQADPPLQTVALHCPGSVELPRLGLRVLCRPFGEKKITANVFTVDPQGPIVIRCREPGDTMRLHGGSKDLKKLFIDRKIPALRRMTVPVIADSAGVLGVYGIGVNLDRVGTGVEIRFEEVEPSKSCRKK